jgi:hypothetical protein
VNSGIRPAIVTLPSGPELLAVWQGSCSAHCCSASVSGCASNNQLRFASRTGGAWSTPADINYAWSDDPVALVSLPNGDAIVAWRAADFSGNRPLTVNRFDHATKTWAGTPAYLPHPLVGSPALARGLGGATAAEVAFVGVDGYAYHCRLVTGSTTTCQGSGSGPNQIGADVNFVSLATAP